MQFTKITWSGDQHTKTVRIPIWRLGEDSITWVVTERGIEIRATRTGGTSLFLGAVSVDVPISDITIDLEDAPHQPEDTPITTTWFPPEQPEQPPL